MNFSNGIVAHDFKTRVNVLELIFNHYNVSKRDRRKIWYLAKIVAMNLNSFNHKEKKWVTLAHLALAVSNMFLKSTTLVYKVVKIIRLFRKFSIN